MYESIQLFAGQSDSTEFTASIEKISECIAKLKKDKSDGDIGLWSNHLIYAPKAILTHIALLFTAMMVHGYTPERLLLTTIISIIKDPSKDICSSNNYRGIALSSCLNKLFDIFILQQYPKCFKTCDLQFAYKTNHSTSLCTLMMKEIAHYYISKGSQVYSALLDASKAFDRVRLDKLIELLQVRETPAPIMRILVTTFHRQKVRTTWSKEHSDIFLCTNGLRQGGVLSPILFSVYFDELIRRLSLCGSGCYIGHMFAGSLVYADDITLLAPTAKGLQTLLNVCAEFSKDFDVIFNSSKSVCIKLGKNNQLPYPPVVLNGDLLTWSATVTHLGNIVTEKLTNAADINFKANDLVKRINSLLVNFRHLSREAVTKLFDTQCVFHGSQQWDLTDNKAIESIHVKWRKGVRRLWNLPWTARSSILPPLINKCSFTDQLFKRFVKLYWSILKGDNTTVKLIVTVANGGIIDRNLLHICREWNCQRKDLPVASLMPRISEADKMRASQLKELTSCLEGNTRLPNFTNDDIRTLIIFIATL